MHTSWLPFPLLWSDTNINTGVQTSMCRCWSWQPDTRFTVPHMRCSVLTLWVCCPRKPWCLHLAMKSHYLLMYFFQSVDTSSHQNAQFILQNSVSFLCSNTAKNKNKNKKATTTINKTTQYPTYFWMQFLCPNQCLSDHQFNICKLNPSTKCSARKPWTKMLLSLIAHREEVRILLDKAILFITCFLSFKNWPRF